MHTSTYIIAGGEAGVDRLRTLADATWPGSLAWLRANGLRPGLSVLDLGCGGGEITFRIAAELGSVAKVVGMDHDAEAIRLAQADPRSRLYPACRFIHAEAAAGAGAIGAEKFDLVYLRFLLSHLKDPAAVLMQAKDWLRPGGRLVVEDVDFAGHFCHPRSPAFERYVELYLAAGRARGADPNLGPRLPGLLNACGLGDVQLSVQLPTFMAGAGKQMALLTWRAIRESVVAAGLSTVTEADEIDRGLADLNADPFSILSLPRIFQVSGHST